MECSRGTSAVTVAVDKLLVALKPGFKGVVWDDGCSLPGCLLTFCGSTRVVVADSSISGINSRGIDAVVCAVDATSLTLQRTNVTHNNAAALAAAGQSEAVVAASQLAHSVGHKYSGGVVADEDATLIITDHSTVAWNVAKKGSGGGVLVQANASVTITGKTKILNNTSVAGGGGVAVFDYAGLVVDGGSCVCYNTGAMGGGGLVVDDRARVTVTGGSSVSFNNATNGTGGGIWVVVNASITISGGGSVCNNTAGGGGGGVAIFGQAQVTINRNSSVCGNHAKYAGGGVLVEGNASVTLTGGSSVSNNTAHAGGGGVSMDGLAQVSISGHSNNICQFVGGGLRVAGNTQLTITGGSSVCNNRGVAGGGLIVIDDAQVTVTNASTVRNNSVMSFSGGGVEVAFNARLLITGGSSVFKNWAASDGGGLSFAGNSTTKITNATICNNTCEILKKGEGAGLHIRQEASVWIGFTQMVGNHARWGSGGAIGTSDDGNLILAAGVVLADNVVEAGYVGSNIAAYQRSSLSIDPHVSADGQTLTKCNRSVTWAGCFAWKESTKGLACVNDVLSISTVLRQMHWRVGHALTMHTAREGRWCCPSQATTTLLSALCRCMLVPLQAPVAAMTRVHQGTQGTFVVLVLRAMVRHYHSGAASACLLHSTLVCMRCWCLSPWC